MTPIRAHLSAKSSLLNHVRDGLAALHKSHKPYVAAGLRESFADSLDLDAALAAAYPNDHRWDYLLGHAASGQVIGLEPHSAKTDQVSVVIRKRQAARQQLASHLRAGKGIAGWCWVASGETQFLALDKVRLQLAQNGILFIGGQLAEQHLQQLGLAKAAAKKPRSSGVHRPPASRRKQNKGKK